MLVVMMLLSMLMMVDSDDIACDTIDDVGGVFF
jgi:hypothetical protein